MKDPMRVRELRKLREAIVSIGEKKRMKHVPKSRIRQFFDRFKIEPKMKKPVTKQQKRRWQLGYAVMEGNAQKVKKLLDRGAKTDTAFLLWGAQDLLFFASRDGKTDIAKLLIERGSDMNAKDRTGETPLMVAVDAGHLETVKLLLKKGADVNTEDKYGATALLIASANGHTEIAGLLKAHGAKE